MPDCDNPGHALRNSPGGHSPYVCSFWGMEHSCTPPCQHEKASAAAEDADLPPLLDDSDIEELFQEQVTSIKDFQSKGEYVRFCRWFSILRAIRSRDRFWTGWHALLKWLSDSLATSSPQSRSITDSVAKLTSDLVGCLAACAYCSRPSASGGLFVLPYPHSFLFLFLLPPISFLLAVPILVPSCTVPLRAFLCCSSTCILLLL